MDPLYEKFLDKIRKKDFICSGGSVLKILTAKRISPREFSAKLFPLEHVCDRELEVEDYERDCRDPITLKPFQEEVEGIEIEKGVDEENKNKSVQKEISLDAGGSQSSENDPERRGTREEVVRERLESKIRDFFLTSTQPKDRALTRSFVLDFFRQHVSDFAQEAEALCFEQPSEYFTEASSKSGESVQEIEEKDAEEAAKEEIFDADMLANVIKKIFNFDMNIVEEKVEDGYYVNESNLELSCEDITITQRQKLEGFRYIVNPEPPNHAPFLSSAKLTRFPYIKPEDPPGKKCSRMLSGESSEHILDEKSSTGKEPEENLYEENTGVYEEEYKLWKKEESYFVKRSSNDDEVGSQKSTEYEIAEGSVSDDRKKFNSEVTKDSSGVEEEAKKIVSKKESEESEKQGFSEIGSEQFHSESKIEGKSSSVTSVKSSELSELTKRVTWIDDEDIGRELDENAKKEIANISEEKLHVDRDDEKKNINAEYLEKNDELNESEFQNMLFLWKNEDVPIQEDFWEDDDLSDEIDEVESEDSLKFDQKMEESPFNEKLNLALARLWINFGGGPELTLDTFKELFRLSKKDLIRIHKHIQSQQQLGTKPPDYETIEFFFRGKKLIEDVIDFPPPNTYNIKRWPEISSSRGAILTKRYKEKRDLCSPGPIYDVLEFARPGPRNTETHGEKATRLLPTIYCRKKNVARCNICLKYVTGDFYNKRGFATLCRNCYEKERTNHFVYSSNDLNKLKLARDCKYYHSHDQEYPWKIKKFMSEAKGKELNWKENYFNKYHSPQVPLRAKTYIEKERHFNKCNLLLRKPFLIPLQYIIEENETKEKKERKKAKMLRSFDIYKEKLNQDLNKYFTCFDSVGYAEVPKKIENVGKRTLEQNIAAYNDRKKTMDGYYKKMKNYKKNSKINYQYCKGILEIPLKKTVISQHPALRKQKAQKSLFTRVTKLINFINEPSP